MDRIMKRIVSPFAASAAACCLVTAPTALADTLLFSSGRTVTGTVLQTNANYVLLLTDYGMLNYSPLIIKEIKIERAEEPDVASTNRLPSLKQALLQLGVQPWASALRQIPATVIDKGMLRDVPYMSFRCGEDYEVNIYGDPEHPAGIEAGVYRKLIGDAAARENCVGFVARVLNHQPDRQLLHELNLDRDLRALDGLTFEITPPFAEDAYQGWWISIYSERALNAARASEEELKRITMPKAAAGQSQNPEAWSVEDLKSARRAPPTVITFYSSGLGELVRNAEVKPYVQGVSLLWRDANGQAGVVKLADLPEDLRSQFGYDASKATAADEALARARAAEFARVATDSEAGSSSYDPGVPQPAGGGSVYVRGYTRSNGTYVSGYYRSSPGGRR
jgi:hypothetical protein